MLINERYSHENIDIFPMEKILLILMKTNSQTNGKTFVEERKEIKMAVVSDVIKIELLLICRFVFFAYVLVFLSNELAKIIKKKDSICSIVDGTNCFIN